MQELLKNTPEEHPDFAGLQKALKRIEEIVAYLNERKRESENQYQMLEIQSKLKADKRTLTFDCIWQLTLLKIVVFSGRIKHSVASSAAGTRGDVQSIGKERTRSTEGKGVHLEKTKKKLTGRFFFFFFLAALPFQWPASGG